MKKQLAALAAALVLTGSAYAAAPTTVLEKADATETAVYGSVQVGALVDRVNQLDQTVYGEQRSGNLNDKVDELYQSISGVDTGHISVSREVSMLEWVYQHKVTTGSLVERIDRLERSVSGHVSTGSLTSRIHALKVTIVGSDMKLTPQVGTIPSTEVFRVTLDTPISTKTDDVGKEFDFTVADDIKDGDVLLVPAGTVGHGHISELKKASSFGRNGKLDLTFDTVPTLDGSSFTAIQGAEAKEKTKETLQAAGASVAGAVLLGPVGLVGGFFVKGKNIELPVGSEIYVQPQTTVTVQGIVVGGDGLNHASDLSMTAPSPAVTVSAPSTDSTATTASSVTNTSATVSDTTVTSTTDGVVEEADASAQSPQAAAAPDKPIVVVKRS